MFLLEVFLYIIYLLNMAKSELRIFLNSNEINGTWRVYNTNCSIHIEGSVPGGIYSDLQDAEIIHDNLFYRFNDQAFRWVGRENWTYEAIFSVPTEILTKNSVNIVFHGVDTVADLRLNDQLIGFVDNMFVRNVIPIKEYLKETNNILHVRFKSPILEASRLAKKQAENYNIPSGISPVERFGESHINFLRKMQSSFSWDWGPAFPSVGIWKSVEIEAFDYAIIRDVTVAMNKTKSKWILNCTIYIESYRKKISYNLIGTLYLGKCVKDCENHVIKAQKKLTNSNYNFTSELIIEVNEDQVDIWWPNGYGRQPLYRLKFELQPLNEVSYIPVETMKEIKIGFRTIKLVEEEITQGLEGLSFYFAVNEVPIFAKGSNWIPAHILPELGCEESVIQHALLSAKEVHMNMLRVWGGGVYECDLFYQIADELGILIWQDMMFAAALYPTDKRFLATVSTEIEQQIRRLQHHPSIALWAGNNENEVALSGNWFDTENNFEQLKRDYIKLYVETIEPIIRNIDRSRPFVVSSPSNGKKSREDGYIAENPYSPLYGDVHFYNYDDDPWNSSTPINTRFASEYGLQSLPSYSTLAKVSKPEDRRLSSRFMRTREHHRIRYENLINLIQYHLPLPTDDESERFFKKFIYYSQILQAMAIKIWTEKYRRDMGRISETNEKFTMGALYWQLNDVWEAPTWSSIEFGGKWKILHYYAKKFFEPVIVSPEFLTRNIIAVFVVSDLLRDIHNVHLNISIYDWQSFRPRKILSDLITVEKAKSKIYTTVNLDDLLQETNCTRNTCFLHFVLKSNLFFTSNNLFMSSFSNIPNLQPANIKARILKTERSDNFAIELKTDKIAPFVWLETEEDGQFSDNGFLLLKESRIVNFHNREENVDYERLKRTLKVHSLFK